MTQNNNLTAYQVKIAELEQKLATANTMVQTLYFALDDASSVVEASETEEFAYQTELEQAAEHLGIVRN